MFALGRTIVKRVPRFALGTRTVVLFCLMALTGDAQTTADGYEADDVIAAMSQTYREMGNQYLIRAVIQKRVRYGATSREWGNREYRLVTDGVRTRAELLVAGKPNYVVTHHDSKLSLYLAWQNGAVTLPAADARTEPMRMMVGRLQTMLYQRFADLAHTRYAVTAYSMQNVKVGRERRLCHRLNLRPASDLPQTWQAEVWIDAETFLIHRAKLQKEQEMSRSVLDEDVRFLEIRSGVSVPSDLLDWQPPQGTGELRRIPRYSP